MSREFEIRASNRPTEGYYKIRLVGRGPWCPASLFVENGHWVLTVNGERQPETYRDGEEIETHIGAAMMMGTAFDDPILRVHSFGRMISETEYHRLLEHLRTAKESGNPDDPLLHPNRPIDLRKLRSLY